MNLPHVIVSDGRTHDRRAHDRYAIHVSAQLLLGNGAAVPARTLDIGKGGAGVVCDYNLPVGTRLTVRLRLPARPSGSAEFDSPATVVNCTLAGADGGFRLGLQFGTLAPAALTALKGIMPVGP